MCGNASNSIAPVLGAFNPTPNMFRVGDRVRRTASYHRKMKPGDEDVVTGVNGGDVNLAAFGDGHAAYNLELASSPDRSAKAAALADKQDAVSGALSRRAVDAINMKKGRDVSETFAFAAGVINAVQQGDNVEAIVNDFVQGYKL